MFPVPRSNCRFAFPRFNQIAGKVFLSNHKSAATITRDENLEARVLAAVEMSTEERKPRTVVSLTFPPPPYNYPR